MFSSSFSKLRPLRIVSTPIPFLPRPPRLSLLQDVCYGTYPARAILTVKLLSTVQLRWTSTSSRSQQKNKPITSTLTTRENIYTIPNALTLSRILACPFIGWSILSGDFFLATGILVYAGVSDWVTISSIHRQHPLLTLCFSR